MAVCNWEACTSILGDSWVVMNRQTRGTAEANEIMLNLQGRQRRQEWWCFDLERENSIDLTTLNGFCAYALLHIFLTGQGDDSINLRTNLKYTDRDATAPPLTLSMTWTIVPQAGARDTGPSDRTFDCASRAKPGKATWQRGFRLKGEE
jgi:hypothetical protein